MSAVARAKRLGFAVDPDFNASRITIEYKDGDFKRTLIVHTAEQLDDFLDIVEHLVQAAYEGALHR